MAKISEEAIQELEALTLPGSHRAQLLTQNMVRLFAYVEDTDGERAGPLRHLPAAVSALSTWHHAERSGPAGPSESDCGAGPLGS